MFYIFVLTINRINGFHWISFPPLSPWGCVLDTLTLLVPSSDQCFRACYVEGSCVYLLPCVASALQGQLCIYAPMQTYDCCRASSKTIAAPRSSEAACSAHQVTLCLAWIVLLTLERKKNICKQWHAHPSSFYDASAQMASVCSNSEPLPVSLPCSYCLPQHVRLQILLAHLRNITNKR